MATVRWMLMPMVTLKAMMMLKAIPVAVKPQVLRKEEKLGRNRMLTQLTRTRLMEVRQKNLEVFRCCLA